jgi:hypothetical protein
VIGEGRQFFGSGPLAACLGLLPCGDSFRQGLCSPSGVSLGLVRVFLLAAICCMCDSSELFYCGGWLGARS